MGMGRYTLGNVNLCRDSMTTQFSTLAEFADLIAAFPSENNAARLAATERNAQLTKPPAALGQLEDLAQWYCAWRGDAKAKISAPQVVIFAGNHGVTAQGVSAFPAEVTQQMVWNFQAGGAAINQLSDCFGATLAVHALDLDRPTQDFTQGPAMSEADCVDALRLGWSAVDPLADVLITGEMGIGNTTAAAALAAALFGGVGSDWVGRGTGVTDAGLVLKADVVNRGLAVNANALGNALATLAALGGREIAAMVGAIAAARHHRIPVILDGFICCSAAAVLYAIDPKALDHCVAGHQSAEAAHSNMLIKINKKPLLALGLKLGEGSGAAVALGILKAAVACHSGMATFAEAGVSEG